MAVFNLFCFIIIVLCINGSFGFECYACNDDLHDISTCIEEPEDIDDGIVSCVPPNGTNVNWFCYTARTYEKTNAGKSKPCFHASKYEVPSHRVRSKFFFTKKIATKFIRGCCEVSENAPYCRQGDGDDDQEFEVDGIEYRVVRCKGNFCNNDTATIEGSRNDELCEKSGCFKTTSTSTTIITTTITTSGSPSSWLKSTKLQCFYFLGGILLHMLHYIILS